MFSIIMPTYNRANIIKRAIESVIKQDYPDWELIIVDDGSVDDTQNVIYEYANEKIRYIRNKVNKGANHVRNIGLKEAKGEYIAFLDSDNQWNSDYLSSQLASFTDDTDIVFACCHTYIDEYDVVFPKIEKDISIEEIKKKALIHGIFDTNVVCIRSKIIEDGEFFLETLKRLQDWEYFLRLLMSEKYSFKFSPKVLCENYCQEDSLSKKNNLFWDSRLFIFEKYLDCSRRLGIVKEILEAFAVESPIEDMNEEQKNRLFHMLLPGEQYEVMKMMKQYSDKYLDVVYQKDIITIQKELETTQMQAVIDQLDSIIKKNDKIIRILVKCITENDCQEKIVDYLKKLQIESVSIWGYGILGKILYMKLKDSTINVKFIIDSNKVEEKGIKTVTWNEIQNKQTGAIIITAISAVETIREEIRKESNVPVLSIEKIIGGE